jgi:hypothetical protein
MTEDQIEKVAVLSTQMGHVITALQELKGMVESLKAEFVSKAHHDNAVAALDRRVSELESDRKESDFFASLRKMRDIALTITAVLAAVAVLAAIARGWPVK